MTTKVKVGVIAENAVDTAQIVESSVTSAVIAGNAVVSAKIAANQIITSKIASNAIESGHITSGEVTTDHLADNAITTDKIAANAITLAKITSGTLTADSLADNSITGAKIALNSIDSSEIVTGSIDTVHIADSQVTNAKLANSSVTVNSNEVSLGSSITLDTDDVGEGSTNQYFTNARAQGAITVTDAGGDGSLGYSGGTITYTGPSAAETRAHFSGSTGISYNSSTGAFTTSAIPNASLSNSSITINSNSVDLGASVTLDTDDVGEGSTNLYFTNARADARIAAATTDDLTEGSTNLYFTNARIDSHLSGGTGVTYSSGAISIGQDVGTTATPTFGNITTTGYIAGPATFTIDPAAVGNNTGTVVIAGNLQVDGTTTTINSTTVNIDDLNIQLATGALNAAAANGAGITVDCGSDTDATFIYDGTNDEWDFNKVLKLTTPSATTASITAEETSGSTIRMAAAGSQGYIGTMSNHPLKFLINTVEKASLTANGDFTITNDVKLTGTNPRIDFDGNGSGSLRFYSISESQERARITSSGNFGIGILNPLSKLHIQGNSDDGDAYCQLIIEDSDTDAGSQIPSIQFMANGSNTVRMRGTSTQGLVISGSSAQGNDLVVQAGAVGIGTTPSFTTGSGLQIYNAGQANLRVSDSTNNTDFAQSGADTYIINRVTSGDIKFRVNSSTELITIDGGSGSVGINNNQPSSTYKLDVSGAIRSNTAAPGLTLRETDASNQEWILGSYGGTFAIRDVTGGTYPVYVEAATPSSTLYLDSTGNVGIGTSTVNALLHIKGTGDAIRVESTNAGVGGAQLDLLHYTTSPANEDINGIINFGGYYSGTSSAYASSIRSIWTDLGSKQGRIEFLTRDDAAFATAMTITHDSKVGIGGAPSFTFQVRSPSNTAYNAYNFLTSPNVAFSNATSGAGYYNSLLFGTESNGEVAIGSVQNSSNVASDFVVAIRSGGNRLERMRITSDGEVGIGTTDPVAKLDVKGTTTNDPSVYDYLYANGSGIRVHGEEAGLDLVGLDDGGHASSVLLRNTNQGFGIFNVPDDDTLRIRSFDAQASNFYIHSGGGNVANLVDVLVLKKTSEMHVGANDSDTRIYIGSQGGEFGGNSSNWVRGSGSTIMYNSALGGTSTGNAHIWETTGAQRMFLSGLGKLTVKTANVVDEYTATFETSTSGDPGIQITRPGTAGFGIAVRGATDDYVDFQINNQGPTSFTETGKLRLYHNNEVAMPGNHSFNVNDGWYFWADTGRVFQTFNYNSAGAEVFLQNNRTASGQVAAFQYRINNSPITGGTIYASTSGYTGGNFSDYRLKNNVTDLTGSLDKINQLRAVSYNHVNTPDKTELGFIAHEIAEVFPEFVHGEKDAVWTQEDIDNYEGHLPDVEVGDIKAQQVDYFSKEWTTHILHAIKELKTENEALKARIEALEE